MPEELAWVDERLEGFRDKLARHGFKCAVYHASDKAGWRAEERTLMRFLRALPKPCGLLAAIDSRAKHVIDICERIGITVPQQISVLGTDNDEMFCEWSRPSISSIQPEFEISGYRLAKLLDSLIHSAPRQPVILRYGVTGIVERLSTLDLTGSARIVALAREYIRKNAKAPIKLSNIAAAAGCSPRVLQRRFLEVTGKTPIEELRHHRLNHVCEMLAKTTTPIDLVGGFCGFSSNSNLKTAFKDRYGMSLSAYRASLT
jgi:LacI family transcriptional regulator